MKTKIMYFTVTGNNERFINKLNYDNTGLITEGLIIDEPFILLAGTINFGEVPIEIKRFLKDNHEHLIGVAGSGNRNWGSNFAKAADIIADKFNVPIVLKFELSGNEHDVKNFIKEVERIEKENE